MITKVIPYHDLDGDPREDEFYFSLNEAQIARLNGEFPGGLQNYIHRVLKEKNVNELFRVIDTLVQAAYGERIGDKFVKKAPNGQPLSDFFVNTEAYDFLLAELVKSEDNFINFFIGCLGTKAQENARKNYEAAKASIAGGATPSEALKVLSNPTPPMN
ncbi:MAG: hypothetical protein J6U54_11530 [Clostridiales bacterium]|nr:hypothetical protein [Clostridiales bacterium]